MSQNLLFDLPETITQVQEPRPYFIPEIKISVTFDKKLKTSELVCLRSSHEIAELLRKVFNADTFAWTEEFIILCLNRSNKLVGFYKVSSGGLTGTLADPKVILTVALNCMATSLILAHNHPSGSLRPSQADEDVTRKIKEAARYLDIRILDHIILSDEGYFSFSDEGIL